MAADASLRFRAKARTLLLAGGVSALVAGCAEQRAPAVSSGPQAPASRDELPPLPAPVSPPGPAHLPPLPAPSTNVVADPCVDRIGNCSHQRSDEDRPIETSKPFDRLQAIEALFRVQLSDCRRFDLIRSNGSAEVFFLPNGRVLYVVLDEHFSGTSTGECIDHRLRRVRVAPFAGRAEHVRRFFTFD